MLTVLITVFAYSLIATVICLYKDNSSYHMMDELDAIIAGPCMWILLLFLFLLRPFTKKRKGKKKKEVVYATQDVRKTVIKYIRIFKRRNKGKEAPWIVPQGTYYSFDDVTVHPSDLKLRHGRYERIENKYLNMCYKEPELVFAVLSEIGHPVTESADWQNFEKEYSFATKKLLDVGAIEL